MLIGRAGASLALGMRYAGSANPRACKVLSGYVRALQLVRAKKADSLDSLDLGIGGPAQRQLHRVDRSTLESCHGPPVPVGLPSFHKSSMSPSQRPVLPSSLRI